MTKEQLALRIAKEMQQGQEKPESFHSYQCVKNYFLDLEVDDLVGIAGQYGIGIEAVGS